jgi:hypothetical protein
LGPATASIRPFRPGGCVLCPVSSVPYPVFFVPLPRAFPRAVRVRSPSDPRGSVPPGRARVRRRRFSPVMSPFSSS